MSHGPNTLTMTLAAQEAEAVGVEHTKREIRARVPAASTTGALDPLQVVAVMQQLAKGDEGAGHVTVCTGIFAAALALILDTPIDELNQLRADARAEPQRVAA